MSHSGLWWRRSRRDILGTHVHGAMAHETSHVWKTQHAMTETLKKKLWMDKGESPLGVVASIPGFDYTLSSFIISNSQLTYVPQPSFLGVKRCSLDPMNSWDMLSLGQSRGAPKNVFFLMLYCANADHGWSIAVWYSMIIAVFCDEPVQKTCFP